MEVYVKKKDKNTDSVIGLTIVIIMFSIPFIATIISIMSSDDPLKIIIKRLSTIQVTALLFAVAVFMLYGLLARPKFYKAKLISKTTEIYKGEKITNMKFEIPQDCLTKTIIKCYTIGDNDLVVEKNYALGIKTVNLAAKYIEEIDKCREEIITKASKANKVPPLWPVFFLFKIMAVFVVFDAILGIILYPEHITLYILFVIVSGIVLYSLRSIKLSDIRNKKSN